MSDEPKRLDFIREIVEEHNRTGRFGGRVQTRFPPEPNGYRSEERRGGKEGSYRGGAVN